MTIVPGQARALVNIQTDGILTRVLLLGATQHPASVYSYEADGKGLSLPFPLGTLSRPIYTCRDLGAYLEFQDSFTIAVVNNGSKPHRYAAIVVAEPTLTVGKR